MLNMSGKTFFKGFCSPFENEFVLRNEEKIHYSSRKKKRKATAWHISWFLFFNTWPTLDYTVNSTLDHSESGPFLRNNITWSCLLTVAWTLHTECLPEHIATKYTKTIYNTIIELEFLSRENNTVGLCESLIRPLFFLITRKKNLFVYCVPRRVDLNLPSFLYDCFTSYFHPILFLAVAAKGSEIKQQCMSARQNTFVLHSQHTNIFIFKKVKDP